MIGQMLKIAILSVLTVFFNLVLKRKNAEYSFAVSLSVCSVIMLLSVGMLKSVTDFIYEAASGINIDKSFIEVVIKTLIIGYISGFCAQSAKDAGEGALAGRIEVFGKICCILLALPMLKYLTEILTGLGG